jgi:hypothetical protein
MDIIRRFAVLYLMCSLILCTFPVSAAGGRSKDGITAYKEWAANDADGNMFLIVLVRNDNGVASSVYMDATSVRSNGQLVKGATSETVYLRPGQIYPLVVSFGAPNGATNYGYNLVVSPRLDPSRVLLANECVNASFTDDGNGTVELYADNISPYNVQARATVIYFNNDNIVDFEEVAITNNYGMWLYPGESFYDEVYTDVPYNASTMYITAVR